VCKQKVSALSRNPLKHLFINLHNNEIYIFYINDQDPEPGQFCSIEPLLAIFFNITTKRPVFYRRIYPRPTNTFFLQLAAVSCIVLKRKMLDISMWVVVPLYALPNAPGQGYNGKIYYFVH
jgi:hypothetical protein